MTKEISFDFNAYVDQASVDKRDKLAKTEKRRSRRRKAVKAISKVAAVAREVLDIYSAVKRKDPISMALGLLSTYGCVSDLFEGQRLQAQERLQEMGMTKAFPMMCEFIYYTLQQMDVPKKHIWDSGEVKDEEDSKEYIEEYDLGKDIKVCFIDTGSGVDGPEHGPYVLNEQEFVQQFSETISQKMGMKVAVNTITKGWSEFFYLAPLRIPTNLYVSQLDEDALMTRVSDLQKLGFNRSLLFFGPPGTGKTTLAARLAERTEGRLLVASCTILESARGRTIIEDLVDIIDPSVILLDDLDKMYHPNDMLESMEHLNRKANRRKHLLIGTVNSLCRVPEALRRPGRFDEIVEFDQPTKDQRKRIILTYGKEFGVEYSTRQFDTISNQTEGMSGAYLKEIALRASVLPFKDLCNQVKQMKRMCNMADEDDNDEDDKPKKRKKKKSKCRTKPTLDSMHKAQTKTEG